MAKLTPPLHTKGRYTLKDPFVTDLATLYTCAAVRTFRDIKERGYDPFNEFYEPMGLTEVDYNLDVSKNASIVTLVSDSQPIIYVPDTYILSYPNQQLVPYKHIVLSVSLGLVPDYVDYTFLRNQIAGLVSDVIGVEPIVELHVAPTNDSLSSEEHDILETTRQAAINLRTTDRANVLNLQRQNTALVERLQTLEQILKNEGLI
jgi:hypothetical protein